MAIAPNASKQDAAGPGPARRFPRARHVALGCAVAVGLACIFYYFRELPPHKQAAPKEPAVSAAPGPASQPSMPAAPKPNSVPAETATARQRAVAPPTPSVQALLPAEAKIIETADLTKATGKPRALILWMLRPTKHSGGEEYCGTTVDGDYWEGPARLSLMDSTAARLLNTVAISGRGDSFRLPFFVSSTYYHVPHANAEKKGTPEILYLQDLTGRGVASEFVLFMYDACGIVSTGVSGYDARSDRVLQYPVEVQKADGKHAGLWAEQIFATKPLTTV